MMSEKKKYTRQIRISNDLDNDFEKEVTEKSSRAARTSKHTDKGITESKPKDDIIDKFLRSCYALIPAVITSGTIAGLLEVAQGWVITAGSPSMIGLTIASFSFWYWIIKKIGMKKKS